LRPGSQLSGLDNCDPGRKNMASSAEKEGRV
jgi:hypothetical protein